MNFNSILQSVLGGFSINGGIINTIHSMDLYSELGKTIVNMYADEIESCSGSLKMDTDEYGTIVKKQK